MRRGIGVAIVYCVTCAAMAANAEEIDLATLAAAIDAPTVGAAVKVEGPIRFGRAEVLPAPGSPVFALQAAGRRCGLLVPTATLRYRVDDPTSLPVSARNLRSTVKFKPQEEGPFVFERDGAAVLWSWRFADLERGDGGVAVIPTWVADVVDSPFFSRPSADLLDALYNDNPDAVYLLFGDGSQVLLADHGPTVAKEENLFFLDRVKGAGNINEGRYYAHPLIGQPVNREWWEHELPRLVSTHTILEVDNDADEHLRISSTTRLQSTRGAGLWRVPLIDRRVENNKPYPLTVKTVTADGRALDFLHSGTELLVRLPRTMQANQVVEVQVASEGDLAIHYGGFDFWHLGTTAWYPQPDIDAELSTFDITLRVPEKHEPFASGTTVSRTTENGYTVLRTTLDKPMQFPVVAAGKYTVHSETRDGVTCRVAVYGGGKKGQAERWIGNFFAATGYYSLLFGAPYPFQEVTIIERNAWGFGQAPPGIIFMAKEAFDQISTETARDYSDDVNDRFVHEVAHAWWAHLLKMNSYEEQWLQEAVADYASALCLVEMRGGGKRSEREMKEILNDWKSLVSTIDDGASLFLMNRLSRFDDNDADDHHALMYGKGALVLHQLRLDLQKRYGGDKGDEAFYTVLRSLLANFPYRWAETRHFIGILNQITQEDWKPWFDRYVFGTEMPAAAK